MCQVVTEVEYNASNVCIVQYGYRIASPSMTPWVRLATALYERSEWIFSEVSELISEKNPLMQTVPERNYVPSYASQSKTLSEIFVRHTLEPLTRRESSLQNGNLLSAWKHTADQASRR
jgi:hypothetical protein